MLASRLANRTASARNGDDTMTDEAKPAEWKPPFAACGIEELQCPACDNEGCVFVREQPTYDESERCDAYCEDCHERLTVGVTMRPMFWDPEVET